MRRTATKLKSVEYKRAEGLGCLRRGGLEDLRLGQLDLLLVQLASELLGELREQVVVLADHAEVVEVLNANSFENCQDSLIEPARRYTPE